MCGIAGIFDGTVARSTLERQAELLAETLRHRGPDSSGLWLDDTIPLALAHRRLSILDLSVEGHQPMISESGRYVISYNGEVYNYQELSRELARKGHQFRGHSDTEVLLAGVEEWGLKETLVRSNGMFALAVWDRERRELLLARDRLGIKPLYFGWNSGKFLFASELRAISKTKDLHKPQ